GGRSGAPPVQRRAAARDRRARAWSRARDREALRSAAAGAASWSERRSQRKRTRRWAFRRVDWLDLDGNRPAFPALEDEPLCEELPRRPPGGEERQRDER